MSKKKSKVSVYWAAPCFSQAERIWNQMMSQCLRALGYEVIFPQEQAKQFTSRDGSVDFQGLAEDCQCGVEETDIIVAILDGPDVDSGTSVECGIAIAHKKPIIGVRTDFRASEDGHLNAMFRTAF